MSTPDTSADGILSAFLDRVTERGLELYPAQEEAILALLDGQNVILNTPTGSGKSLVAEALHYASLVRGQRSFYTAPIKALVNEKFFALAREFGPDNVGMMTGDASINRDAPIVCATAEILANMALVDGEHARVDQVIMDEFHFYADKERGVAWQVPLLELKHAQFLLMSATLGDTAPFVGGLTALTGKPTTVVGGGARPVPLEYEYRETPIHESLAALLEVGKAPVYVVHFTQRAAIERAQDLLSVDYLSKDEKQRIKEELEGFRFDSPFGKDLKRFILHGVGVHHAGLLPKYRRLVERLTGKGLLRIVCGTDTLGVGINVPIRTVLFTQLCKFDGEQTRVLSVRDFQQIAGRAGRKGFDDAGTVWAQAPEHVVENKQLEKKVAGDPGKKKKVVFRKPPERGYVHFDQATFERLISGTPEALQSRFRVSHAMVLQVCSRPEGCAALRTLIKASHESPTQKRRHGRRALQILRSLKNANIVTFEKGAAGRVTAQLSDVLQPEFSLHQALSPFLVHAIDSLPEDAPDRALCVLSIVESVLESPRDILMRQKDCLKDVAMAEMKAAGVEYEERIAELEKIDHPKPLADFIYGVFDEYRGQHPWLEGENVRPKSIAREMYETGSTFRDYIKDYGLERMEGTLLRYLSDLRKSLADTVPRPLKDDDVDDIEDWVDAVVRQIDSSLLEEWEKLRDPSAVSAAVAAPEPKRADDILTSERRFLALVRNEAFAFLEKCSRGRWTEALSGVENADAWKGTVLADRFAAFAEEHGALVVTPKQRGREYVRVSKDAAAWTVEQSLTDEEGPTGWHLVFRVDLDKSRAEARPVLTLEAVGDGAAGQS